MRVLVLCDDYWHPARTARAGLRPMEEGGFSFDWIQAASAWSAERMAAYPLVVLTKSNHSVNTKACEAIGRAFLRVVAGVYPS